MCCPEGWLEMDLSVLHEPLGEQLTSEKLQCLLSVAARLGDRMLPID